MPANRTIKTLLLSAGACALLSACQTTGARPGDASLHGDVDKAVAQASIYAQPVKSLPDAERAYKRHPQDDIAAADYARALREAGSLDQAAMVLDPIVKRKEASSYALSEYAAVALAQGSPQKAEEFAQKAVLKDDKNFRAYQNLGIALETQGKHPEAEKALRKALELWQGDPVTIMNNLALNLSAQGYVDESIDILRKAQALAPDRIEIERNLRIVTALQQTTRGPTPMPPKKPDHKS
jgi:Flp pilus assembly protein TadD